MALVKVNSTTVVPIEAPTDEISTGFVPIYENAGVFTAELSYETEAAPGAPLTPAPFTLISYTAPFQGFTATQKNNMTIKITGTATNVFQGSAYEFLMPDNTVQTLPVDTNADFLTLVKWSPPSVKYKVVTHTITASFVDPIVGPFITTFNIQQDVYWKLGPSLQSFRNLLARGRV